MISITGTITAFFLVIYLLSQNRSLATAMLAGSVLVGFTATDNFIANLQAFFPTLLTALVDPITIQLVALVALVTVFAYIMKETSLLQDLIEITRYFINNLYLTITAIPSVIGMLPIPGGAIFSAPIIAPIGKKMEMSGARMTSLNIYYRHLWYFSFPYMPSLIIASSLSGLDVYTIAAMHLPIVALMIIIGWLYYTKTSVDQTKRPLAEKATQEEKKNKDNEDKPSAGKILSVLMPFIIVLFPPIFLPIEFTTSLIVGILFVIILKKNTFKLRMIKDGFNGKLTLGVLGIMIFRTYIENSEGVFNLTELFMEAGIPLLLLAIIIPFLAGLLTGNHVGAIGIAYPILLVLFNDSDLYSLWHMIIFSSSYFGYILSPFHLCNLMTVEYFDTTLKKYYRDLVIPFTGTAAGITVLSIIYYYILNG